MKRYTLIITEDSVGNGIQTVIDDKGKLTKRMAEDIINYVLNKSRIVIRRIEG